MGMVGVQEVLYSCKEKPASMGKTEYNKMAQLQKGLEKKIAENVFFHGKSFLVGFNQP